MRSKNKQVSSEELSAAVISGMEDKKASKIVLIDLKGVSGAVADYFVVCTGSSDTQVESISKGIDEAVHKQVGENPWHVEGRTNREWILLDYGNVVAHIFKQDKRDFFALEDLWGDAKIIEITN